MLTMGAAKRMVVDGKRITTQDLNYTILKRQYMYAPLQHREQHLMSVSSNL